MKRVSVYLDQAFSEEISSVAKTENKTLYAFANEWLPLAAKLTSEGWSPQKIEGLCDSISLMKAMDAITLPSDFVDELIARLYKTDKEGLLKMFRDLGIQIANLLKIQAGDIHEIGALVAEFLTLLPLKIFNLSPDNNRNTIEIKVAGVGRRIETTECGLELLVSFLKSYGFSVRSSEVNIGTLRVSASNN